MKYAQITGHIAGGAIVDQIGSLCKYGVATDRTATMYSQNAVERASLLSWGLQVRFLLGSPLNSAANTHISRVSRGNLGSCARGLRGAKGCQRVAQGKALLCRDCAVFNLASSALSSRTLNADPQVTVRSTGKKCPTCGRRLWCCCRSQEARMSS